MFIDGPEFDVGKLRGALLVVFGGVLLCFLLVFFGGGGDTKKTLGGKERGEKSIRPWTGTD